MFYFKAAYLASTPGDARGNTSNRNKKGEPISSFWVPQSCGLVRLPHNPSSQLPWVNRYLRTYLLICLLTCLPLRLPPFCCTNKIECFFFFFFHGATRQVQNTQKDGIHIKLPTQNLLTYTCLPTCLWPSFPFAQTRLRSLQRAVFSYSWLIGYSCLKGLLLMLKGGDGGVCDYSYESSDTVLFLDTWPTR